jgi:hypothetical protein
MNRAIKHGASLVGVALALGAMGGGCLTRPVEHSDPTTKIIFNTIVSNQAVDKIDMLFMIDNSASMGDKQALLAAAVPDMINRLVAPNCLDTNGNVVGSAASDGSCSSGAAEFPPVHDMHIGIVDSSLGGRGGDECSPTTNPRNDDRGELINPSNVTDADSQNFLAWFPNVQANAGKPGPTGGEKALGTAGAAGSSGTLIGDFTTMIGAVHEDGCGFEAQNEAWYRFLIQPDPFQQIVLSQSNGAQKASYQGVDYTILQQRADFLRPDSLVAVIVVTDENEEVADPLALNAQGWLFENQRFPSSSGTAPAGTKECSNAVDPANATTTGPYDPNCTSCAFVSTTDPSYATRCPNGGTLATTDDQLNVRFFNQKQRFGVFVGYPVSRYVMGLTSTTVPDSAHEHDTKSNYVGDNPANANCVNPLFAASLPSKSGDELCALQIGGRKPDLVYYAAIAGVPHQLLQAAPGDTDASGATLCPANTNAADCPQKDVLSDADWLKITGKDPEHYDFTGADFHMIESEAPRTSGNLPPGVSNASNCPPGTSPDTCDPINGREWDTKKGDLQYSCIFQLSQTRDCASVAQGVYCDCGSGNPAQNTPLCQNNGGTYTTVQVKGKAYPSVREMVLAHKLGKQGIVSSLCPIHVTEQTPHDPLYGYRPAVNTIVNRLKAALTNQCLNQKLLPDPNNNNAVPCLLLVTLPDPTGTCTNSVGHCDASQGLQDVPQELLARFCQQQEAAYKGNPGDPADPALHTVCQLNQLTNTQNTNASAFDSTGSCANPPDGTSLGWCYVEGAPAGKCPQAILFTKNEPPHGAQVNIQCIEQSNSVVGDGGGGGSSTSGD